MYGLSSHRPVFPLVFPVVACITDYVHHKTSVPKEMCTSRWVESVWSRMNSSGLVDCHGMSNFMWLTKATCLDIPWRGYNSGRAQGRLCGFRVQGEAPGTGLQSLPLTMGTTCSSSSHFCPVSFQRPPNLSLGGSHAAGHPEMEPHTDGMTPGGCAVLFGAAC